LVHRPGKTLTGHAMAQTGSLSSQQIGIATHFPE